MAEENRNQDECELRPAADAADTAGGVSMEAAPAPDGQLGPPG